MNWKPFENKRDHLLETPEAQYTVCHSIDEHSGETWHSYFHRFVAKHNFGELEVKIGIHRTLNEGQFACEAHYDKLVKQKRIK